MGKEKSNFVYIWAGSLVLILVLCVFGVMSTAKDTFAYVVGLGHYEPYDPDEDYIYETGGVQYGYLYEPSVNLYGDWEIGMIDHTPVRGYNTYSKVLEYLTEQKAIVKGTDINSYTTFDACGVTVEKFTFNVDTTNGILNGVSVVGANTTTTIYPTANCRKLDFGDNGIWVSKAFFMWFQKVASPTLKCYYKTGGYKYVWTNLDNNSTTKPSEDVFSLDTYKTQTSCEAGFKVVYNININDKTIVDTHRGNDITVKDFYSMYISGVENSDYNFKGWYSEKNCSGNRYGSVIENPSAKDYQLYACYGKTYSIKYDANGGRLSADAPTEVIKNEGEDLIITTIRPVSVTGNTFVGWNTERGGTGTSYLPGDTYSANESVTLYAQWDYKDDTIKKYKVDETEMLVFVPAGVTKDEFEDNVSLIVGHDLEVEYKTIDGKEVLYTGGKIKILAIATGSVYKEYGAVVLGDVNGDGELGTMDYIKVYNHLDNSMVLLGSYEKAADINQDDDISTMDYITIYNALGGN